MKTNKMFVMALFALMVSIPGIVNAGQWCEESFFGASYSNKEWPFVTDAKGVEVKAYSRVKLFDGKYKGLCDVARRLNGNKKISCPAVAGAMSYDLTNFPFEGVFIFAPGFMGQLDQAIQECGITTNGKLRTKSVVVTLVNDGPNAILPTRQLIDALLNLGVKANKIIVQSYPKQMPNYQREHEYALQGVYGPLWSAAILAFIPVVPTQEQYMALRNAHAQALKGYRGTQYIDIYKGIDLSGEHTFDGIHPEKPEQFVSYVLNIEMALH